MYIRSITFNILLNMHVTLKGIATEHIKEKPAATITIS